MKKTAIILLLLVLTTALIICGCGKKNKQILRVGTNAEYPPFEYMNGKEFAGVDIEIAEAIAAKMGMKCEFFDMDFYELLPSLAQGTIDMAISSITITEDRKAVADFSEPYYYADQVIVAKPQSNITINKLDDLAAYRIGTQNGTTGEKYLDSLLVATGKMPGKNLRSYTLTYDAIADLLDGNIDLVIIEDSVTEGFNQRSPLTKVFSIKTNEHYGVALPKGSKYLAKVNAAISSMKADGSLTEIFGKHLGEKPYEETK